MPEAQKPVVISAELKTMMKEDPDQAYEDLYDLLDEHGDDENVIRTLTEHLTAMGNHEEALDISGDRFFETPDKINLANIYEAALQATSKAGELTRIEEERSYFKRDIPDNPNAQRIFSKHPVTKPASGAGSPEVK